MIKKAEMCDVERLANLAVLMWKRHTVQDLIDEFSKIMLKGNSQFFLKYEQDIPVGFAQCQLRNDYVEGTDTSPVGYLEGVFVKEDYRHKGYAKELLSNCEKWAKMMGCVEFASDCEIDNDNSFKFMLLAQLTMQGMSGYVYPDYYNNAGAQSASTLTMMVGMLLAAALVKPLAKRFGKCEVSVASSIFAVIVNVVLMVVRPENVWVYVAFQFLCWLGLGMFSMVTWALITDVIDYSELKNGKREDGTVYALYSFARKLGQAASAGLTGLLLEVIGYSAATRTDPTVQAGLFNISVLVPALGFALLAAILWFWYPLHKKQVDENVVALKAKHENEKN